MADDDRGTLEGEGTTTIWAVGRLLAGRYRLEALVGQGAMGIVWRARDEMLDLPVALKRLPSEMQHDPRGLKQLRAEARTAFPLRHPGIVGLHTLEEGAEGAFLMMEYVEGVSLAKR